MKRIKKLEAEMYKHARNLEFEEAAQSATRSRSCATRPSACPVAAAG